jgi:hypothetical protein
MTIEMVDLLRAKGIAADGDWGYQEAFAENEYERSVVHGSADKVLSVDSTRDMAVQGNYYRQIHEVARNVIQFIGLVNRSEESSRTELLRTTGIVDARSKTKLYLTVKSPNGNPESLVLSRDICSGPAPSKGDFVAYIIYKHEGGVMTHTIEKTCPPQLDPREEAMINDRINKLSF